MALGYNNPRLAIAGLADPDLISVGLDVSVVACIQHVLFFLCPFTVTTSNELRERLRAIAGLNKTGQPEFVAGRKGRLGGGRDSPTVVPKSLIQSSNPQVLAHPPGPDWRDNHTWST